HGVRQRADRPVRAGRRGRRHALGDRHRRRRLPAARRAPGPRRRLRTGAGGGGGEGGRRVIRIVLADDERLVRGAIATLLTLEDDLAVVAEVGRGDEVVAAVADHRADIAVLDVEMPGLTGLEAASALRTAAPSCGVLILTSFGRPG